MLIECKKCNAIVEAEIMSSYQKHSPEDEIDANAIEFSFLRCPKCHDPILAYQVDVNRGFEGPFRIYPPQEKQINPSFPEPIRNAYQEALSTFRVKAFTAAAIMCRKTLEGVCRVHGIKPGKGLKSDLKEMKEIGIIDAQIFEWAEALRIFGNEAAHDVKVTISRQDAKDIIEFTDALLEYVFTYRDKFNEFNKRRQRRLNNQEKQRIKETRKLIINKVSSDAAENLG